jgi:hypothetical protein
MLANARPRGREADLWRRPVNVVRALSLVPDEVRALREQVSAHYLSPDEVPDPRARRGTLSRPQMELVAGRVSALRECFY